MSNNFIDIDPKTIKIFSKIMTEAKKTFDKLTMDYPDLFNNPIAKSIKSKIFRFLIELYFGNDKLPKTVPFTTNYVNAGFGNKRAEIHMDNSIFTVSKVTSMKKLPNTATYKEEYASHNQKLNNQLMFDLDNGSQDIKHLPYYGIISYILRNNELKEIGIIIPDSEYKNIVQFIPIPLSISTYEEIDDNDFKLDESYLLSEIKKEFKILN